MRELLCRRGVVPFLLAEGALYAAFLFFDLLRPQENTAWLKFAAITLCLAMAVWSALHGGDRLVAWALGLTVGADVFLLLLDRWYLVGVLLFYLVQLAYLLRLAWAGVGRVMLPGRAGLFLILLLALLWSDSFTALNAACALYITHFFFNLLQSRRAPGPGGALFFWGLLLYFLCDLCVGLYNSALPLEGSAYQLVSLGMWFFYLPGQVLIVLSGLTSLEGDVPYGKAK